MTREEAIKFAEYAQIIAYGKPDVQEFYKLAESALRQQETVTNRNGLNEPLKKVSDWLAGEPPMWRLYSWHKWKKSRPIWDNSKEPFGANWWYEPW